MKILACFLLLILFQTACSYSVLEKIANQINKIHKYSNDVKKNVEKEDVVVKNDVKKDKKAIKFDEVARKNESHRFVPHQIKFTSFSKCDPCPEHAECVPPIQCPAHLKMSKQPQMCDLPGNSKAHGLCCTTKQNHTTKDFFKKHGKPRLSGSHSMKSLMSDAKMEYKMMMHKERSHARTFSHEHHIFPSSDHFHQFVFMNRRPDEAEKVFNLIESGFEQMMAAKVFKDKQQMTLEESQLNHFNVDLSGSSLEKTCRPQPKCPAKFSRYRTLDGTCNHQAGKGTWGAAQTPMERLLPPAYEDGIWMPRVTAHDGSKLESPRTISRILFPDIDRPHPTLNLMVMQFGQFLAHDVTQSSSISLPDGNRIKCCSEDGSSTLSPHESHFACMPITIDPDDHFYRRFNQRCMNFVRLAIAPDHDCKLGYAKTLTKVTHYIDGSTIYGSDSQTSKDLRSFKKGQLKMFIDFNRELLPLNPQTEDCVANGAACFMAGDARVNQHTTLVALHMLFAREHNRVAEFLHRLNPHWSDDVIFEETRRIVVAEIQHITYNEWLPLVIGHEAMQRFSLFSASRGYSHDYDDEINPSVTNEFTGAAFRFGHSTVQGRLFIEFEHRLQEILLISDTFHSPGRFRFQHFFDEILRTLVHEPMQSVDNSVTFGLSRYLFLAGNPFGRDLVSINIQRGRDEAIRPYNEYLAVNGRKPIEDFHEFGPSIAERLEQVYKSPDDVDLYVGGLLESSEDDAIVGPTFRDIIADQFSRLRRGDHYFYEHSPETNPGYFSEQQLEQIKRISLARIICDNSDHLALVTQSPHAFIQSNLVGNDPIQCESSEIPGIDFSPWKD